MIDAKELRLGNWVKRRYFNPEPNNERFSYEPCRIEVIKPLVVNIVIKDKSIIGKYPVEQLEPIPLDPDILGKAGFEKCSCGGFIRKELHISKDNGQIHYKGTDLFNLHQLQNLYFSLVGKELEIEL